MNKAKGNFWKTSILSVWMNTLKSGLFTTRTVDELLWGYEDPLLARIAQMNPEVDTIFGLMYGVGKDLLDLKRDEMYFLKLFIYF